MTGQVKIETHTFYQSKRFKRYQKKQSDEKNKYHRPLLVGSSGGGGHNAAMEAIIKYLIANNLVKDLPDFTPVLSSRKKPKLRHKVFAASVASNKIPLLSPGIKKALHAITLPNVPDIKAIDKEIESLSKSQAKGKRKYIDMLVDVFRDGYYHVAIWNLLQKRDETKELRKLIPLQCKTDQENYEDVKEHFLNELNSALNHHQPYTEIISTQAMALPALCDAVREYNEINKDNPNVPNVTIHQYMTDLPTNGAVHFFETFSNLTEEQRRQIYLYGVNLEKNYPKLNPKYKASLQHFARLINIDPTDNPMVRPGFKDPALQNISNEKDMKIKVQGQCDLSLMALDDNKELSTIDNEYLNKAKQFDTPILIRKNNKFFIYGDKKGKGNWDFTKITAKDGIDLNSLPFDEKIIRRSDKEFTQSLAKTIKRGHTRAGNETKIYEINANEKIACISLGSLASDDSIEYAFKLAQLKLDQQRSDQQRSGLLRTGQRRSVQLKSTAEPTYNKIFVFGGNDDRFRKKLKEFRRDKGEELADRIVLLDFQNDISSAQLLTRANLKIRRRGGLGTMEEMAIPHKNPNEIILLHSKRDPKSQFTSGISWEDENGNELIAFLKDKLGKIAPTSVDEVIVELMHRHQRYLNPFNRSKPKKVLDNEGIIIELINAINYFRDEKSVQTKAFVEALDGLGMSLINDFAEQKEKGFSPKKIGSSATIKIAQKTTAMLNELKNCYDEDLHVLEHKKNTAIREIVKFDKECSRISGVSFFAKAIAVVIAAAIGFTLGAAIGGGIGFFLGAWSGPGAVATTLLGLFQGAFSGAALGLLLGTAATGITLASVSGYLLFKPNKMTNDIKNVAKEGKKIALGS